MLRGNRAEVAWAAVADQERAVLAGVQYLKGRYVGRPTGESAMIALGLLKAEVPPTDPAVQACVAKLRTRFTSSCYEPELCRRDGHLRGGSDGDGFLQPRRLDEP